MNKHCSKAVTKESGRRFERFGLHKKDFRKVIEQLMGKFGKGTYSLQFGQGWGVECVREILKFA